MDQGPKSESPAGSGGTAVYRPLENSAKKKGVRFLLNYHMDAIVRETPSSGRVLGIRASYTPKFLPGSTTPLRPFRSDGVIASTTRNIIVKAKRAVIVATGGSSSNVNFRRMFDGRFTEEYQVAGEPYSSQDASGEFAGMAIGASLWGTANQTLERNGAFRKRPVIGAQYIYPPWTPESPIFPLVRATGLRVADWQDVILVNQVGKRFYDETRKDGLTARTTASSTRMSRATGAMRSGSPTKGRTSLTPRWRRTTVRSRRISRPDRSGQSSMPAPWRERSGTWHRPPSIRSISSAPTRWRSSRRH